MSPRSEPHADESLETAHAPLHLGPEDHGRPLSREAYERAEYAGGYDYELVAGRLYVSPKPNLPHDWANVWLYDLLRDYARAHPEVFAYVTPNARLITEALGGPTDPEPDLAAYRELPTDPLPETWAGLFPALVVEVVSPSNPKKDLDRNRRLYGEVEAIEEYWVLDPRQRPPALLALVRGEDGWVEHEVPAGGVYRPERFPGLVVDLSRAAP